MPLQGHWERQNTPLRRLSRRERRLAVAVTAVLALSVAIGTFFVINDSPAAVPAGCVDVEVGSTMGGGKLRICGRDAVRTCRSYAARNDPGAQPFNTACGKAGIG